MYFQKHGFYLINHNEVLSLFYCFSSGLLLVTTRNCSKLLLFSGNKKQKQKYKICSNRNSEPDIGDFLSLYFVSLTEVLEGSTK